jgi:hypothetical protein
MVNQYWMVVRSESWGVLAVNLMVVSLFFLAERDSETMR